MAVVAASERALAPLLATASRSGWRTVAGSAESIDPLAMTTLLLEAGVSCVLVGASDPPAADERRALGELAALVAAAAGRRRDLTVVLAGGMSEHLSAFGDIATRAGEVLLGPAAKRGTPGGPLADLLVELALPPNDARRALGAGAVALAEILDRRVDVVEVGFDAGTRAAASPGVAGGAPSLDLAVVAERGAGPPRSRRFGRRPGRPVVDLGRRPASPARPPARTAARPVGGRDRRWRHAPDGRRPGRPRTAQGMDPGMERPATGRPDRRDRRRLGRRAGTGRRARPGRRPAPARAPASTPSTTPGSSPRSGRSRMRMSGGR